MRICFRRRLSSSQSLEGKASANYAFTGDGTAASVTGTGGTAPGLSGIASSIFGGNGATYDQYTFSYTPGVDADNTTFTAGQLLGDNYTVPNYATGVTGGGSGLYNVYATWIYSTNVNVAGATFTANSDAAPVNVGPVDQNTGQSGSPGGDAGWFCLGTVSLTAGNTYTVQMNPLVSTYVSMRSAGVMWEMVAIPEPSTLALSIVVGGVLLGLISQRRSG